MVTLLALFFLSGAAGLIYEVVWARLMSDVVGSTAVSMSVVFSVFLAGLAVGSWVFGRSAVRGHRALALYAVMELGIALSALATTWGMYAAGSTVSTWLPGSEAFVASLGLSTLVTVVALAVPTFLMGGTLPVLLNAVATWGLPRREVARLYGWNTLGAAVGALAAGVVLIWRIGMAGALLVAVSLNLAAAAGALALSRRDLTGEREPPAPEPLSAERMLSGVELWPTAFLSGFVVLAYEILWGRLARFLLGDRTIAISMLLFVFVATLGIASLIASRVAVAARRRAWPPTALLGALFLVGPLLHVLAVPLAADTIAGGGLTSMFSGLPEGLRRAAVMIVLVGPPISVLGLVFPLLASWAREIDREPGRVIGRLYLTNTAGAVIGALIASFLLSEGPGTISGFGWVGAVSCLVGATFLVRAAPSKRARGGLALVAAVVLVVGARPGGSLIHVRADEELVISNEDEYGVQVLTRTDRGTIRVRNNRLSLVFDLGDAQTTHAQQMPAHLAMAYAGGTESVLNVGTGYGITAGTFTLYPDIDRITTVEILPFLVEAQPRFAPYNFRILEDPRVTLVQGDGRHVLLSSRERYDVISVNVLDPYLPGSSGLYTPEFWERARERLKPGGVFTQLLWGEDLPMLVRGIREAFPQVLFFPAYGGTSYNVLAFRDAPPAGIAPALSRLSVDALEQLAVVAPGEPSQVFETLWSEARAVTADLTRMAATYSGPLHTDWHPILEYRWAHGVEGVSVLDSPLIQY